MLGYIWAIWWCPIIFRLARLICQYLWFYHLGIFISQFCLQQVFQFCVISSLIRLVLCCLRIQLIICFISMMRKGHSIWDLGKGIRVERRYKWLIIRIRTWSSRETLIKLQKLDGSLIWTFNWMKNNILSWRNYSSLIEQKFRKSLYQANYRAENSKYFLESVAARDQSRSINKRKKIFHKKRDNILIELDNWRSKKIAKESGLRACSVEVTLKEVMKPYHPLNQARDEQWL